MVNMFIPPPEQSSDDQVVHICFLFSESNDSVFPNFSNLKLKSTGKISKNGSNFGSSRQIEKHQIQRKDGWHWAAKEAIQ